MHPLIGIGVIAALTGCTSLTARGVSFGLEAIDASKDYVDEQTDYREETREEIRSIQRMRISLYREGAVLKRAAGDRSGALKDLDKAEAEAIKVYPTIPKIKKFEGIGNDDKLPLN